MNERESNMKDLIEGTSPVPSEATRKENLRDLLGGPTPRPAMMAEGDVESSSRGSCARLNGGKVALSMVPMHLLHGVARVFMGGALKYAPWNWAKCGKWSTPFDCMMRHMFKWWFMGEDFDQESGEHHLDHVMANLLFLIHYRDTFSDGDDRPKCKITCFSGTLPGFNRKFDAESYKKRNEERTK